MPEDWSVGMVEGKFRKATLAVWPFMLNMGIVALYYRVSGILLDRTTGVGEILIASGD